MLNNPPLEPPPPVLTAELFPGLLAELLDLLRALSPNDWDMPTVCEGWSVKDVALHLLGGEIGNLSKRRDDHTVGGTAKTWDELVEYLSHWNETWVDAARRISPRLLIDLLELSGGQMADYFAALDPFEKGSAVTWAGPEPAPVWLDIAREYTERWHHQQHIRDAVGVPGAKSPRWMAPALATFVWALPRTFRAVSAPDGTSLTLTLSGDSGGRWSILRGDERWRLVAGAPAHPDAEVTLPDDIAWRLFTHSIEPRFARKEMTFGGDMSLGLNVLQMTSIIA